MNILIVEDDEMLLKSLSYFLTANSFNVIDYDNGLDAISYIEEKGKDLDVVITDLNLPFAGGQQVIKAVKENPEIEAGVIVLTSSGVEATELEVFDLGADDFITKPFSPSVLLKRMKKLIPVR